MNYPNTITASGADHVFVLEFDDEVLDDDPDSPTCDSYVAVYRVTQVIK